jgi:integrase
LWPWGFIIALTFVMFCRLPEAAGPICWYSVGIGGRQSAIRQARGINRLGTNLAPTRIPTSMLTDAKVRGFKPKENPFKVSDSGGLFLLIQPSGSKLWRMAYRFAGRQKTLAFGIYDDVSLADARVRRDDAKRQLRAGEDPSAVVKAVKQAVIAATTNTFNAVAQEWLDRKLVKEKKSASTLTRADWLLRMLGDGIGERPLNEITTPELLRVLRKAEAAGRHETVARLRSIASQIFRYGIATGRCDRDVAADLRGATTTAVSTPHAAIVDHAGIGKLMREIDSSIDGGRRHQRSRTLMQLALRLIAYTFVRPGELRLAEWPEIEGSVWDLPGPRMKMRLPHRVPLSKQALAVLAELRTITGGGKLVFASTVKSTQPFNVNALNDALRRMGFEHDQHVAHGFRSTFSTTANDSGRWSPDVIELQLAHVERNKVRGAYNRAQYWPERVEMMQWYSDFLDELRDRGKVVALPNRKASRKAGA